MHEVTVVVGDERWGAVVRQVAPLFVALEAWVEEWLSRQPTTLADEPCLNDLVALAERFPDLVATVDWVRVKFERDSDYEVTARLFEAVVALVGMSQAIRATVSEPGDDWRAPHDVREAFLELWHGLGNG